MGQKNKSVEITAKESLQIGKNLWKKDSKIINKIDKLMLQLSIRPIADFNTISVISDEYFRNGALVWKDKFNQWQKEKYSKANTKVPQNIKEALIELYCGKFLLTKSQNKTEEAVLDTADYKVIYQKRLELIKNDKIRKQLDNAYSRRKFIYNVIFKRFPKKSDLVKYVVEKYNPSFKKFLKRHKVHPNKSIFKKGLK
jgi:hypothetical protein